MIALSNQRLLTASKIALEASKIAKDFFAKRDTLIVKTKQPRDFVSKADGAVEEFIRTRIGDAFTGEDVLGEEAGGSVGSSYWVIDPIDGTSNFLRGSPLWGISIAYVVEEKPVIGVLTYPVLGMQLSAAAGEGVLLDGRPFLRPPPMGDVKIAGVGENAYWHSDEIGALEKKLRDNDWGVAGFRCASVALGFAALSHTDGYLEKYLSVWDLAAGVVICQESGLNAHYEFSHLTSEAEVWVGTNELLNLIELQ